MPSLLNDSEIDSLIEQLQCANKQQNVSEVKRLIGILLHHNIAVEFHQDGIHWRKLIDLRFA